MIKRRIKACKPKSSCFSWNLTVDIDSFLYGVCTTRLSGVDPNITGRSTIASAGAAKKEKAQTKVGEKPQDKGGIAGNLKVRHQDKGEQTP